MPQASPELRAEWPDGDGQAISFLEGRGYKLTKQWEWIKPSPAHEVTPREWSAIDYLIHEWDFGDVIQQLDRDEG